MKENRNRRFSDNQGKPLVASKGFRKFDRSEHPVNQSHQPHFFRRREDFLDDDDFDDEEEQGHYGKFRNFEKMNRRNESAGHGHGKVVRNIKPADVCVIANFHSPTFSGRVGTSILAAGKEQHLSFAASERRSYSWQQNFELPESVKKTLEQPDASKSRCYVSPLYNFGQEHVGPADTWVAGFDAINPDMGQLRRLQRAGLVLVPSQKHADVCKQAGIKPQNIKIAPLPVDKKIFNANAECPAEFINKKGYFRIITSGNPLNRKGLEDVLVAYIKEFKPTDRIELIIKLTHLPKVKKDFAYEILDFRKKLGALNSMFAKVTIIDRTLTDKEYAGLLASCDVFAAANVSFNSAINVREAVACGLTVIGADYLPQIANLPMNSVIPVKTVEFDMPKGELYAESPVCKVRKLDAQGLGYAMRKAFNAKDSLRGRKAGVAASFHNTVTWEDIAKLVTPKKKEE